MKNFFLTPATISGQYYHQLL